MMYVMIGMAVGTGYWESCCVILSMVWRVLGTFQCHLTIALGSRVLGTRDGSTASVCTRSLMRGWRMMSMEVEANTAVVV